MGRPQVRIDVANQIAALRQHQDRMLPRFVAFPGVVGLTLNGGLSRGYGDHLSEIDVTFYLTPEAFLAWKRGKAPAAEGITVLEGQLYDLKFVDYVADLGAGMSTGDGTIDASRARQLVIRDLWEKVDQRLIEVYWPGLPVRVMQRSTYQQLKLLVEEERLTLDKWRGRTGGEFPNRDPFYPVVRLEGDHIVVDRRALLEMGPDAIYAWQDAVLRAVAERHPSRWEMTYVAP